MIKYNKNIHKIKTKKYINSSKVERNFARTLTRFGIKYKKQYELNNKFYDYYLPEYNLLIEIDGNYWHGNTNYYPILNKLQRNQKIKDKEKNIIAKVFGYDLLRLWEHEVKNEKKCIKKINEYKKQK